MSTTVIPVGGTATLEASAFNDANATQPATQASFAWTSDTPSVATVKAVGVATGAVSIAVVTAVAVGTANITATATGTHSDTANAVQAFQVVAATTPTVTTVTLIRIS